MADLDKNKKQQKPHGLKGKTNNPAGRPKGTSNKISGTSIIAALEQRCGRTYEEQLADNYLEARLEGDRALVAKYDQMFLNKVVGDLANLDLTSGGERLQAAFSFVPTEIPDWMPKTNDSN